MNNQYHDPRQRPDTSATTSPNETALGQRTSSAALIPPHDVAAVVLRRVAHTLEFIELQYGDSRHLGTYLPYHNRQHTEGVVRRGHTIIQALREAGNLEIDDRFVRLFEIAASHHDVLISSQISPVRDGDFMRDSRSSIRGEDERASAEVAVRFMTLTNQRALDADQPEPFSKQDCALVYDAVLATVPTFKGGGVEQEALQKSPSTLARVLCLADLGTAGIEGPPSVIEESKRLFLEANPDMFQIASRCGNLITPEIRFQRMRITKFAEATVRFVEHREEVHERELSALPEPGRDQVRRLFTHFAASREAAKGLRERLLKNSFSEQLRELGLSVTE